MKPKLESLLLAASLCLPFSGGAAFTTPMLLDVSFPTSVSVPEDGGTHTIDYILTNNTGVSVTLNGANESVLSFVGDTTDRPNLFSSSLLPCLPTLMPGGQCTVAVSFTVFDGTGETDADSGTLSLSLTFTSNGTPVTPDLVTMITVNDVPGPRCRRWPPRPGRRLRWPCSCGGDADAGLPNREIGPTRIDRGGRNCAALFLFAITGSLCSNRVGVSD